MGTIQNRIADALEQAGFAKRLETLLEEVIYRSVVDAKAYTDVQPEDSPPADAEPLQADDPTGSDSHDD